LTKPKGPGTRPDELPTADLPLARSPAALSTADSDPRPVAVFEIETVGASPNARAVTGPFGPSDPSTAVLARPWLEVVGELGGGGMSELHRVLHQSLRRLAAMKSLRDGGTSSASARRLIEEAQITGQLDHPNIPAVHDLWLDPRGQPHFTMKLVRGQTLTQLLATRELGDRSDEDLEHLLRIFLKVCDAVSFAHSRGVVHRDLKPDNIMVGSHGQVYVVDWGCALLLAGVGAGEVCVGRDPSIEALDPPGAVVGTYSYMAPEQAQAQSAEIDELTDVYLLGGILYEILTRWPPHRGIHQADTIRRAIEGLVEDPQLLVREVRLPPVLCAIAMRALQPRPADRHGSVEELKAEVELALRNGWWFTTASFPSGTVIVREGDTADAAYIITRGTCEAFHVERTGRALLRRMGPGEVFGETAILTSGTRTASVEAIDDVTALVVTREALEREIGGTWLSVFLHALAVRFQELDARLSDQRRQELLSPR
jgi:serine/threonine-protein kinase